MVVVVVVDEAVVVTVVIAVVMSRFTRVWGVGKGDRWVCENFPIIF